MSGDLPLVHVHADIQLTHCDIITLQNITASIVTDHEENPGNVAQMENLALDHPTLHFTEQSIIRSAIDCGDFEAHGGEEQNSASSSMSEQRYAIADTRATLPDTSADQGQCAPTLKSSSQVSFSMQREDIILSNAIDICAPLPASESTALEVETILNVGTGHTITQVVHPPARETPTQTTLPDDKEASSSSKLTMIQTAHSGLDGENDTSLTHSICADEVEDNDNLEDFPPCSLPPSSSPPQLFSSSPYASSQSSHRDAEIVEMADVEETKTLCECPQEGDGVMKAADECCLEGKDLICHSVPDCAAFEVNARLVETDSISHTGECSRERVETDDDAVGTYLSRLPPPSKRMKLDPKVDQPPAPKRVTLSSQRRHFQKLAAPFRTPLKLPMAVEVPFKNNDSGGVSNHTLHCNDEHKQRAFAMQPPASQRKITAKKTSRSNIQFKSPLIDPTAVSGGSPAVRLTPAVQTLERKLQLLKRAVKVKEDNEERILLGLTTKWLEAGREVAYEVWDTVRNSTDGLAAAPFRRSHGWEDDRETKSEGMNDECCDNNYSQGSRARGSLAAEDVEVVHNTLGIMLRQLGIAPETLGWDDDRETFVD